MPHLTVTFFHKLFEGQFKGHKVVSDRPSLRIENLLLMYLPCTKECPKSKRYDILVYSYNQFITTE